MGQVSRAAPAERRRRRLKVSSVIHRSRSTSRCSNSSLMKDQTYWAYNYCPTSYSWLVLLGLVLYLAAFAPGERRRVVAPGWDS